MEFNVIKTSSKNLRRSLDVAEAYYGIPTDIRKHALTFLDQKLMQLLILFENKYPPVMEKMHDDMSVREALGSDPIKKK